MKKKLNSHPICLLYSSKHSGRGFYFHKNMIMTTHHNFEEITYADVVWAFFPSDDFVLIFKCKFNNHTYKASPDTDTALLHFDGDASPLGEGLSEKMYLHPPLPGTEIFFYRFNEENLSAPIRRQGEIITIADHKDLLENEFLMSTHGIRGDSGSPIFDQMGNCIGAYRGILHGNGRGVYLNHSIQPRFFTFLYNYLTSLIPFQLLTNFSYSVLRRVRYGKKLKIK